MRRREKLRFSVNNAGAESGCEKIFLDTTFDFAVEEKFERQKLPSRGFDAINVFSFRPSPHSLETQKVEAQQ